MAALEATLLLYRSGEADAAVPTRRMLATPAAVLREAAEALAARIPGATVEADVSYSGGGALPEEELPAWVVCVPPPAALGAEGLAAHLRSGDPPVVARVRGGQVRLDPRTLLPGDTDLIVAQLRSALL